MVLSVVPTTEQLEAAQGWIYDFYKCLDSFNLDGWLIGFCEPNIVINFGNIPSMKGYKEIHTFYEQQNSVLSLMKHELTHIDVFSDRIYVQSNCTFKIKNDPEQEPIKFRAVAVFWKKIDEDKVSAIDIYSDPTPIGEKIKMCS